MKPDITSLGEAQVANVLASEMKAAGFIPAADPMHADVIAIYSMAMGEGQTNVLSMPDYVTGGHRVLSETSYPRFIQVFIVDGPKSGEEIEGRGRRAWVSWL
jgi:hypothetical protein